MMIINRIRSALKAANTEARRAWLLYPFLADAVDHVYVYPRHVTVHELIEAAAEMKLRVVHQNRLQCADVDARLMSLPTARGFRMGTPTLWKLTLHVDRSATGQTIYLAGVADCVNNDQVRETFSLLPIVQLAK